MHVIVEHGENYPRACVKETVSEMCLNSLVMKFAGYILIISVKFIWSPQSLPLGNNVELPFPIQNRSCFHYARMERVWGLWWPHGGSGICAKAVPGMGLWQNPVHLGFRTQEQEDTFTLRLFLCDTKTASQSSKKYSPDAYLATGCPSPCHIRAGLGRHSKLAYELLGTGDYFLAEYIVLMTWMPW